VRAETGQAGEVLVRGYGVTQGYWDDPEATAEAIDTDGWLHTGDIGVMDAAGNLRITDRLKDMYVVGGFNAYPAEVEQVLVRHEGVSEAAVIGVPDARLGEVGKAFDASAPCGPLKPASQTGHPSKGKITLKCNGKVRQDGDLAQMIWNVPEVISKLSEMVALEAGDIIMTGTPSGVAATVAGDKLECEVEGLPKLTVTIGQPLK